LIELLLAVSIFCVVAITVSAVFYQGMRLSRRLEARLGLYRDAWRIFGKMERDMENFLPFSVMARLTGEDEPGMIFPALLHEDNGEIKIVRYFLLPPKIVKKKQTLIGARSEQNAAVRDIRVQAQPLYCFIREEESMRGKKSEVILSARVRAEGIKFRFGILAPGANRRIVWQEVWPTDSLPVLARVELSLADSSGAESRKMQRDIIVPAAVRFRE